MRVNGGEQQHVSATSGLKGGELLVTCAQLRLPPPTGPGSANDVAHAASRQLTVLQPDGAFYFYVKVPGAGTLPNAGDVFCRELLENAGVAIVPGSAFRTPDWVRISYAADQAQVMEACRRIAATADAMA